MKSQADLIREGGRKEEEGLRLLCISKNTLARLRVSLEPRELMRNPVSHSSRFALLALCSSIGWKPLGLSNAMNLRAQ